MDRPKEYPDIGDIIARKESGRRERARLSFGEKLDLLDKLRTETAPIAQARVARDLERGAKT